MPIFLSRKERGSFFGTVDFEEPLSQENEVHAVLQMMCKYK